MHGLARQIIFLHIVLFAITARRVSFVAIGYLAGGAAIDALAFGGEAAIAAYLLIVAKTETPGDLGLAAILGLTETLSMTVFAFGGEAAVAAHLLIVARAITGGACSLIAIVGPT